MPDFAPLFQDSVGGARGLFQGMQDPQPTLDFNSGMFGSNPLSALLGNMGISQAFGAAGMLPAQFLPQQNLYDQYYTKAFWQERQASLTAAGGADRETYARMFRGVAKMTGRPMGLEQERAARSLAGGISAAAPFLQMLMGPETFDALHGVRGSATVMAGYLHDGGRMGVDPVTGETGIRGDSAGVLADRMHREFFGEGADLTPWRGLGAGRVGQLYDELQTRGLAGRSIGTFGEAAQQTILGRDADSGRAALAALERKGLMAKAFAGGTPADRGELNQRAVSALKESLPEEYDKLKMNLDAKQVGDRLKSLAGVTSAMRDIFGDLGRPNAPMKELVEGLNQLTQGGLATQDPAQLEKSVRLTQALAKSTGVGMDGMMGLMARGAGLADSLGLDRRLGLQAAQGAAAFGAAFGQAGEGATPHWMARSKDEMTLLDENLRARASKSGLANQLGATTRIVDAMTAAGLPVGDRAKALAEAIRRGDKTFGPNGESVFQSDRDWRATMTGSGIRENELLRFARQTDINQQAIHAHGIGDLVRESQGADVARFYAQAQRGSISDALQRRGMGAGRADDLANRAALAAGETLRSGVGVDGRGFSRRDDAERDRAVAASIRRSLGRDARGLSDGELRMMATSGWGAMNQMVHDRPDWAAYKTGLGAFEANDPAVAARRRQVTTEATVTGAMRSALAGLGQAGPLARISDALQSPADTLGETIAAALGGVKPADVAKQLAGVRDFSPEGLKAAGITDKSRLGVMLNRMGELAKGFDATKGIGDPKARAAALAALQGETTALMGGGAQAQSQLDALMKQKGIGKGDLDAALRGETGLKGDDLDQLRALHLAAGKGIVATATAADLTVGAKVGQSDTADALGALGRFDAAAKAGNKEEAARHRARFADQGHRVVDQLLGDRASVEALGAGGLAVAREAREAAVRLRALERAGKGDSEEAGALRKELGGRLAEIGRRQADPKGKRMGKAEADAAAAYREDLLGDDATQNRKAIDRLVESTGGKAVSDADRDKLAAQLGKGEAAEAARAKLDAQLKARREIDEALKEPAGPANRARLEKLEKQVGSVYDVGKGREGTSFEAYQDSLRDAKPPAEGPDLTGKGGATTNIVGTLKLEGLEQAILKARGAGGGPGATPVV